jgi:hypothetical protein
VSASSLRTRGSSISEKIVLSDEWRLARDSVQSRLVFMVHGCGREMNILMKSHPGPPFRRGDGAVADGGSSGSSRQRKAMTWCVRVCKWCVPVPEDIRVKGVACRLPETGAGEGEDAGGAGEMNLVKAEKLCSGQIGPAAIIFFLTFFLIAAKTSELDSVFERIRNSLPKREVIWKILKSDGPYQHGDGSKQADYIWSNGSEEVRATVILHGSLKAAKEQFKNPQEGEPAMNGFLIDGIGDEAYLFPPVILNQQGPFNLRFRKAQFEISMSANSKDTIRRCAWYIIDSISRPTGGVRPKAPAPHR